MPTSPTLTRMEEDIPVAGAPADVPRPPHRPSCWWRLSKLSLALAFLAAAAAFFYEQVWTVTSLEGTLTSPLITLRSPIDGVVTASAASLGAPVHQQEPLFVIAAHPLDTRLRAELAAKLTATQQQTLVLERKIADLSTLRQQLQARQQVHREATLTRLEMVIAATTADLNRAKAVKERTQQEVSRSTFLAVQGLLPQARLDDAVLAAHQAHFEVERVTASLQRLTVERTAAKQGVVLSEGYSDAPYAQQRMDELTARLIEATAERASLTQTHQELASRLSEEQRREAQMRTSTVHAPSPGIVWNLHSAADGVVARNSPLADVVDCQRAFVEATVPESRYDAVQLGETVQVKLRGHSRTIAGTIQAVRGQSAVVHRESLAAWLRPRRTTEAMTVSVVLDPDIVHQVFKGVCQIGRSAKVYFGSGEHRSFGARARAFLTSLVSSPAAAGVPTGH
jgi:multidrug resistance efflux pump